MCVRKNGGDVILQATIPGDSSAVATMGRSVTVELLEGDYLELLLWQNSGGNLDLSEPDTETERPDGIVSSTNIGGAFTDIDDDPDSPDANWMSVTDETLDCDVLVSFPTPTITPSGTQECQWYLRKSSSGAASVTYTVTLYENGSSVTALKTNAPISSDSGKKDSATFDASEIGNWARS